jgi:hypothetical protein
LGAEIDANLDIDNMSNADFAEPVIKHSPKMQSIIALYMDWGFLHDGKIIFWFMTPMIQEMTQR